MEIRSFCCCSGLQFKKVKSFPEVFSSQDMQPFIYVALLDCIL